MIKNPLASKHLALESFAAGSKIWEWFIVPLDVADLVCQAPNGQPLLAGSLFPERRSRVHSGTHVETKVFNLKSISQRFNYDYVLFRAELKPRG